jgi:hypothetical protein
MKQRYALCWVQEADVCICVFAFVQELQWVFHENGVVIVQLNLSGTLRSLLNEKRACEVSECARISQENSRHHYTPYLKITISNTKEIF